MSAACRFPPNHPTISLQSVNESGVESVYNSIYVYTDTFNNCIGNVTNISVCYDVFFIGFSTLISIGIINEDNIIIHVHNINGSSENQAVFCELLGQFFVTCCIHKMLTPSEQFRVERNYHFGVWASEGLYIHPTTTAPGYNTMSQPEIGRNLSSERSDTSLQVLFFYFDITPGNLLHV